MRQGRHDRGGVGWFGPRPPAGDPPHGYHFQVLALDAMLDLPGGATREELLADVDSHVIAKGGLVATSQVPTQQQAPGHEPRALRGCRHGACRACAAETRRVGR